MILLHILIVGGGKIGTYLAESLQKEGNKISLVEKDEERSKKLARDLEALIINGDGTNVEVLRDAGAVNADVLVAVTDDDDTNLVACQFAKNEFSIKRTIARVNDESKESLFENIGVDDVIPMANAAATSFKNSIRTGPLKTIFSYGDEDINLNEVIVKEDSEVLNKTLEEINFPENSIVVSIIREDNIIFPSGKTTLKKGDKVQILMYSKDIDKIEKIF
ncbi:hypothetical protein C9439_03265 [archaeon SCG-AAA382B04]|nr:hypothetical protein C9439_03265 [archaeon SCG-AAA382B04]